MPTKKSVCTMNGESIAFFSTTSALIELSRRSFITRSFSPGTSRTRYRRFFGEPSSLSSSFSSISPAR